jgi:MoaA/NifB/PqqE/SkfB family radical SAM enzyme
MNFYTGKFFEVQIENSSICNAACPQCVREITPEDKSWLQETYLETEFFNLIPDHVYQESKIFFFCGNIGDPCAAPNFLDVCRLVRQKNPNIVIKISTNGGLRNPEFWSELATIVGDRSEVIFAIDGLEDTNHIYRVNVRWGKIIENVKAFVSAGGKPYWQYITFKHNQHQVADARSLSEKLGFQKFMIKPSHRFALDEVLNRDRGVEPPDQDNLVHKVMLHKIPKTMESVMRESAFSDINCYVLKNQSVYIDHLGRVFPCCFLAAGVYARRAANISDGWNILWDKHKNNIDLRKTSWQEIIEGSFFRDIKNTWDKDYNSGRLFTCATTCSSFKNRLNDPTEFNKMIETT